MGWAGSRPWSENARASVAESHHRPVRGRTSPSRHNARVDTFEEIADERRALADLLAGLTAEQRSVQSLCSEWSVLEVIAHLVVPLQVSIPSS